MAIFDKNTGQQVMLSRAGAREDSAQFMQMVNNLREENDWLIGDNDLLQESMDDLQRSVDDLGWQNLSGFGGNTDESGMPLDTIRRSITNTRSLVAANPLVRKGVRARIGFIWGEGITVTGNLTKRIMEINDNQIFSSVACEELETAMSTDGNVFFFLDQRTKKIRRVPMSQITDFIVDPDDSEVIQFVKRTWTARVLNENTGRAENIDNVFWFPTIEFINQNMGSLPASIGGVAVEQNQAINIVSANKQVGWLWGVPDLISVMYWSFAYKQFLESEYTLVRALAKFAFKITDTRPKGQGAKQAAVKVAQPNNRAGIDAGATTTMSGGMDMTAINKAGANVNFDAGRPLAAMVAAGLEVPLSILLAEPKQSTNNYEISLDPSTVKAAQSRQRLWTNEFTRMFKYLGANNAKVKFPPIQSAPIHRVVQAIVTAASSGVLFPAEVRELTVKAMANYGIDPKKGLPEPGQWAEYATPAQDNPGTTPQNTPDNTDNKRSPAGPLADGDHEQRPSE